MWLMHIDCGLLVGDATLLVQPLLIPGPQVPVLYMLRLCLKGQMKPTPVLEPFGNR
jgi:hypothetical protein